MRSGGAPGHSERKRKELLRLCFQGPGKSKRLSGRLLAQHWGLKDTRIPGMGTPRICPSRALVAKESRPLAIANT